MIRIASYPRVQQVIDIVVFDILEGYRLFLRRDWSAKIQGYFSIDWSHIWIPHKGKENQICVNSEAHMNHTVTELEGKNEPISFSHFVLGNYFFDNDYGCYESKTFEIPS